MAVAKKETACYPKPAELLSYEIESLQKMAMASWPAALSWWKRILLEAASHAKNQGILNVYVWFEAADPRAASGAPSHVIELGAKVYPAGAGEVSYFFAISTVKNQLRHGLRKMNFDLDLTINVKEPKPAMHMQISGRRPPSMGDRHHPDSFKHLHPKLDKPRIVCLPNSFAMLTHMALLEYHSTDTGISNMVSDPTWLAVVRSAEERLLKPHFEFCLGWMAQTAFRSRSLLSRFYGLPTD
jgi:hypothetical protein